jgi:two-component system OmpR family response regulator
MSEDVGFRRNKVVLGVDDQPENLMILRAVLETAGYAFLEASTGAECLSLAARSSPRLILLDVQMPGMDGFETCRRLRSDWRLKAVPVAFLTGRKSVEDVKAGIGAGGNDFITKPFDRERLLARVDHWARKSIVA